MILDPNDADCPCGSGLDYTHCCEPYVTQRAFAPTAQALMRSRYTAYALNKTDYLLASWHPQTRPLSSEIETASPLNWQRLQILKHEKGDANDLHGTVTFIASYLTDKGLHQFCEMSRFQRIDQQWFYLDGDVATPSKNGPCPCGSGKKHKRCCFIE